MEPEISLQCSQETGLNKIKYMNTTRNQKFQTLDNFCNR